MIIKTKGKYRLLQDYSIRKARSIYRIPKGAIIEITQIDEKYHHAIGPTLGDWVNWDMPVDMVKEE